jgi:hypothetical protein
MTMAKANPIWRISSVIGGKKAEYLGIVIAPNVTAAIDKACEEFGIEDAERRKRLVAQPIGRGDEQDG